MQASQASKYLQIHISLVLTRYTNNTEALFTCTIVVILSIFNLYNRLLSTLPLSLLQTIRQISPVEYKMKGAQESYFNIQHTVMFHMKVITSYSLPPPHTDPFLTQIDTVMMMEMTQRHGEIIRLTGLVNKIPSSSSPGSSFGFHTVSSDYNTTYTYTANLLW